MLCSFVSDQNPRKKFITQLYALSKVLSKNLSNQAIIYRIFKMQSWLSVFGRQLIFVSLEYPFLYTCHSEFKFLTGSSSAPVKGCQMPALLLRADRLRQDSGAGVGQASREETAGCAVAILDGIQSMGFDWWVCLKSG